MRNVFKIIIIVLLLGFMFYCYNFQSSKIKVAIIDSGYNDRNNLFDISIKKQYNFIDYSNNITDKLGHGTAMTNIIAQDNWNNDYYIAKVTDNGNIKVDNVVAAIQWAIENKVDVIHMSLGFKDDNNKLRQVIQKAIQQKIIIVAAAGNEIGGEVHAPARYREVISVAGLDNKGNYLPTNSVGKVDYVISGYNDIYPGHYSTSTAAANMTHYILKHTQINNLAADLESRSKIFSENIRQVDMTKE